MAIALVGCGDDDETVSLPSSTGLGNFSFSCDGQSGSQKQVQFQQQQQQGCGQQVVFKETKVDDFQVDLDCDAGQVRVTVANESIPDSEPEQAFLPIQSDGSVKGTLNYPQQIQSDGKGNTVCWVEYRVDFDGKAECEKPRDPQDPDSATDDVLSLTTQVALEAADPDELEQAGISGGPGPSPSPSVTASPTPSPSVTASPTPSPSVTASPTPSPSVTASPTPSPSVTASPTPTASPTGSAVVVCVVENPCPIKATTDASCPSEQVQQPEPSPSPSVTAFPTP